VINVDNFKKIILFVVAAMLVLFVVITSNLFTGDNNAKLEKATAEKIEEFDRTNIPSKHNKYAIKSVNHEEMAMIYYNDYKNMIINYPDEAYDLIINIEDITKEEFNNYRDELIVNYHAYKYEKYSYYQDSSTNNFVYRIVNSNGDIFTFITEAVMCME